MVVRSSLPPTTRHHSPDVPSTVQPTRPGSLLFASRQFGDEAQVFEERDGGYDDGYGWRGRWLLSFLVIVAFIISLVVVWFGGSVDAFSGCWIRFPSLGYLGGLY